MKIISLLLIYLLSINIVSAQQKAVTEIGEEVILYEDGTWKYLNEDYLKNSEIPTNPKSFKKGENSSFLLKSNNVNVGFWLNPKIWSFKKAIQNPDAEFELQLKNGSLYAMVITEKVEIPLETLKSIALENGKNEAPDLKIVKEEYRIVNGAKVLLLEMNGTLQGIKFSYYGYYFSSTNGTVQFITYTSQKLLEEYRSKCESLLNGFIEIN
jgi:hypothetical protein